MAETLTCPNCGAPLDYQGNDPIIRCPYCNTSVVVPDNLRAKPSFSSKPSNYTLSGIGGDMGSLVQKARRIKEVKDLALAGNMEEANRLYRELTNASEIEANAAVQALAEGRPIMLSSFSSGSGSSSAFGGSTGFDQPAEQFSTSPTTGFGVRSSGRSSRMGCLVGCFVTGLTLFILAVTLIPIFATSIPMLTSSNGVPDIMLTAVPDLASAAPEATATVHTYAQQELSFGGEGTGAGLFDDPRAIAVDPKTGSIFVANYEGGRVQQFDEKGKFVTQWTVGDKKTTIQAMAADHKDNLFIAAGGLIYRYKASTAEVISKFKPPQDISYYEDIVAAPDGTLYAIGGGETVLHLDINGKVLSKIPKAISSITDDSELDTHVAVDGDGNLYLLGTFSNGVFKYGANGKYVNKFGGDGDEPGQFRAPDSIAVDGKGNIYVSDFKGIQVFDKDGRYVDVIDVQGAVFGMTFDDQGNLYVTSNVNKILKFVIPQQ